MSSEPRRGTYSLPEWHDQTYPGVELSDEGRVLAKQLSQEHEHRIEVNELREGLRVRTRSWVGVVRLDDVEIRVTPKLAGDPRTLARLLELTLGVDGLTRATGRADLDVAGAHLFDLIVLLFVEACLDVVRRGLLAGYVEREEALPVMRGRILPDRQILKRFGQLDRIVCRFDELELDIDENRLLAAALRVAHLRVQSPLIGRRIARLRAIFEPICDEKELDLKDARNRMGPSFYNRLNASYRPAHALAWLLLDGLGVDDLLAQGETRSFAFLLDMNLLFERFVERLVRRELPEPYRIEAQASQSSIIWDVTARRSYLRVRPDLVVERRDPRARLAIDAKYKLYDERRLDPGDIYQTFLYAYALGERVAEPAPTALILYPATAEGSSPVRLRVLSRDGVPGAEIETLSIPIEAALDEVDTGLQGPILKGLRGVVERLMGRGID